MRSQPTLLKNGRICDPATDRDEAGDLLIREGKVAQIGVDLAVDEAEVIVLDLDGHLVIPGLVDLCAACGEPGAAHLETFKSLGEAALRGGVTSLLLMPDGATPIDGSAMVDYCSRRASAHTPVGIYPAGALTQSCAGEKMAEMFCLHQAGARAFTDGFERVEDPELMLDILRYAATFDFVVMHHVIDKRVAGAGVMHAGEFATRLGLEGSPSVAEIVGLERDLRLAEASGAAFHALALSTAQSVEAIRGAKHRGQPVSAGVSVNNLVLNAYDVGAYRTFLKVDPPLRGETDRFALVEAVRNGDIDVIVSTHRPRDVEAKRLPFAQADFGAVGVETLLSAGLPLVQSEQLTLTQFLAPLTYKPAQIIGIDAGTLRVGARADIAIVDLTHTYTVTRASLHSLATNTPFENAVFSGKVMATFIDGVAAFVDPAAAFRKHLETNA